MKKLTADTGCLEQAVQGLLTDFRVQVEVYAELYGVPHQVVRAMAQDMFLYERAGYPTESLEFWSECAQETIREEEESDANIIPDA